MSDASAPWGGGWLNRIVARPGFQAWAARFPLTRPQARADGAKLFQIVQGFVSAQTLFAVVELDILRRLRAGPQDAAALGRACDVPEARMQVLLQSAAALGLLKRKRGARFALSRQGAAMLGVPGLEAMIRHHKVLYEDLKDPVALLRDQTKTGLAEFWPYVFGPDIPQREAETYSDLMAQSQVMVAQDTLDTISLKGVRHLMDVGGGSGAFLSHVMRAYPALELTLFDLPHVVAQCALPQVHRAPGSFRGDSLPNGADAISLVRVLYDHSDDTVRSLLGRVHDALPVGGQVIISEPMGGGRRPDPITDVYFAFYTMAMQTGRVRSADEIAALLAEAGFTAIKCHAPRRSYVTQVVSAQRN
jgi:demethylspheroidene O-methyltransferase